jgi:hypothetical protein
MDIEDELKELSEELTNLSSEISCVIGCLMFFGGLFFILQLTALIHFW